MNADTLVSDSELVGAYASQGLIIGPPEYAQDIESAFMQQHIRGLRMAVDFALGRLAPAKPIAVISPAVQDTAHVQTRLEAAGYVVVVAHDPARHVVVLNAPPTPEASSDVTVKFNRGWREGDTITLLELDDSPLPTLDDGLYWDPIIGKSGWVVIKSPPL